MAQKNGRTPPAEKLESFTFKDTGRTVQIRKVSTLLRTESRRQIMQSPGYEEPQPPMTQVDYGDGKVTIPHPGHPVYQQLHREWEERVREAATDRLRTIAIRRGVVVDEVDHAAVAAVRSDMAELGIDLSGYDDTYVYVAFVCIGSEEDWVDLLKAIFDRSLPSEGAIQQHIATFQPDVQEAPAVQPEP